MSLRGKEKVETEIGIAFMAVNIKKLSTLRVDKFYLKLKQEVFSFFIMKIFLFSVLRHINVPAPNKGVQSLKVESQIVIIIIISI